MKPMDHLALRIRLTLYTESDPSHGTFGKGVAVLLRGVETLGSLNASAKSIKMAYSKAWRLVKESEQGLGFDLIDRRGAKGSTLTAEGQKLLAAYERMEKDSNNYLVSRFQKMLS